ncbi:hypothetical protein [Allorhodopirellula solitaria]|uniref:Uncharacterized protein n=1 Tax=Allorhodopirellula solitaria TaxID=2527987 RepID=A0A5C5XQC2_9BACT|nr:hypothetical protein [Allorhodopirellula solitaria]TWT64681.1 hypothetical protein CA85_38140 [Allorhodopirellula solitaria]
MAVRLSVLMLHPPGGGSTWHAHSDDMLGHLLGRPGLDVTLLERLPRSGEDSTETLALESIGGHIACLAWQDAADVLADLDRAGRPMVRRPHAGDPDCDQELAEPESAPPGRIYFFDMRRRGDAEAVLTELHKLLQTLQVSTFQIASASQPGGAPKAKETVSAPHRSPQPVSPPPRPKRSETRSATPTAPPADDLDRLVDELDAFDG